MVFGLLKGKTILITGASSGIGADTARLYAEVTKGEISLILIARRLNKLEDLKVELNLQYSQISIEVYSLDLSDIPRIVAFGDQHPDILKRVDILVNNAGFAKGLNRLGAIPHLDVLAMINTNLTGLITLTQLVLPYYKDKNSGDVVNIGSISGRDPYIGGAIYCTTKTAISTFSDVLRKEYKDTNVRVIEILPGLVQTEFASVRHDGDKVTADKVYQIYETLTGRDVAEQIIWATSRRAQVQIADLMVLPTHQASMRDPDMQR